MFNLCSLLVWSSNHPCGLRELQPLAAAEEEPHAVNRTGRTALMEAANLGASEATGFSAPTGGWVRARETPRQP